jgi:TRAP transporter 4TM/12TM fusion protein
MDRSAGDTPARLAERDLRSAILPWLTTAIAVYHLGVVAQLPTWLGVFIPDQIHQAISLCSAFILLFVFLRPHPRWTDILLLVSGLTGGGFVIFLYDRVLDYGLYGFLDVTGMILALMLVVPLLEAVRRAAGWALPIIILAFILVTIFQVYLPGVLFGTGFSIDRVLFGMYVGDAGVFGLPLNVAANIVIVYLIFGALMHEAGASLWFMDLSLALTGWSRGGPAKAAVVASALLGSISGSPSGNSATTGVFTIPMMKSVGYRAPFAAAVEAVASTGGMILPPVMGAIAFLMAAWIEVPYSQVVFAAAVPAALYFLIVFISVHLQALKDGIAPLTREELPKFLPVFLGGWHNLIPIAALFYFLVVASLPPGIAGTYTCGFVLLSSYLSGDRNTWLTFSKITKSFEQGVSRWVVIAVITAAAGMLIGSLELSGVGIKISRFVVDLAGGNLPLTMLFVGVVSLIVGMGLDATPAYITLATLMAPALIRLGVPDIGAHLFVIYWGLASFFTPPTCLAVFVTCGIAGSGIWETGWEAVRLGIAAFIIPFAFVLNPGLLLDGPPGTIIFSIAAATMAASLVAAGVRGYAFEHLAPVQRGLLLASACLLISSDAYLALGGALLATVSLVPRRLYGPLAFRRQQS